MKYQCYASMQLQAKTATYTSLKYCFIKKIFTQKKVNYQKNKKTTILINNNIIFQPLSLLIYWKYIFYQIFDRTEVTSSTVQTVHYRHKVYCRYNSS